MKEVVKLPLPKSEISVHQSWDCMHRVYGQKSRGLVGAFLKVEEYLVEFDSKSCSGEKTGSAWRRGRKVIVVHFKIICNAKENQVHPNSNREFNIILTIEGMANRWTSPPYGT